LLDRQHLAAAGEIVAVPGQGIAIDNEGRVARDNRESPLVLGAGSLVTDAGDRHSIDIGEGRAGEDGAPAAGAVAYDNCNPCHAISLALVIQDRLAMVSGYLLTTNTRCA